MSVAIMFSQPPEDDQNKTFQNNPRQIAVKSSKIKNKRKFNKKKGIRKKYPAQSQYTIRAMSSWAENFTHAATWQMKHQIAYWKSKATALEYENRILHEIIRKNYLNEPQNDCDTDSESITEDITENDEETEKPEEDENLEVSEEFIQFLKSNAKYREDARREREKFKAAQSSAKTEVQEMESMPVKNDENKEEMYKTLYGKNWERIAALETCVQSNFLNASDGKKVEYWPNIPLNFNFG